MPDAVHRMTETPERNSPSEWWRAQERKRVRAEVLETDKMWSRLSIMIEAMPQFMEKQISMERHMFKANMTEELGLGKRSWRYLQRALKISCCPHQTLSLLQCWSWSHCLWEFVYEKLAIAIFILYCLQVNKGGGLMRQCPSQVMNTICVNCNIEVDIMLFMIINFREWLHSLSIIVL